MAFNTHSRRDLYASSEPRPKDSSKRRNGSPPKKSSTHKNAFKKTKKMSKEEISVRTYKSISLLLDAARVLDEEEKKASKPSPSAKTPAKSVPKKATSSKATPVSSEISPVAQPPVATVPPPPQSPIKPIHDDHQYTASTTISSTFNFFNDHPSSSTTYTQPLEESSGDKTESMDPTVPLSASTPLELLSISVPEATVPMLSPIPPMFRPSTVGDAMTSPMHRPIAALPIPAELRDIAVPIAHRSVSTVTRVVATKTPRKTRGPNKKKAAKTTAELSEEMQLQTNFGYPNECRTRIPPALRRYWERLERQKRQSEVFFHDYFWQ